MLKKYAAVTLLLLIQVRVYLTVHARQIHLSELVGGKRIWRVQAARRTWRTVREGHADAVRRLCRRYPPEWTIDDLPASLRNASRLCTWPLPLPHEEAPREVQAARSVA